MKLALQTLIEVFALRTVGTGVEAVCPTFTWGPHTDTNRSASSSDPSPPCPHAHFLSEYNRASNSTKYTMHNFARTPGERVWDAGAIALAAVLKRPACNLEVSRGQGAKRLTRRQGRGEGRNQRGAVVKYVPCGALGLPKGLPTKSQMLPIPSPPPSTRRLCAWSFESLLCGGVRYTL